jgi:hypothetical protein
MHALGWLIGSMVRHTRGAVVAFADTRWVDEAIVWMLFLELVSRETKPLLSVDL